MIRTASMKHLFSRPLDVHYTDFQEKPTQVQFLDLNTNFIISEGDFIKRLRRIPV